MGNDMDSTIAVPLPLRAVERASDRTAGHVPPVNRSLREVACRRPLGREVV